MAQEQPSTVSLYDFLYLDSGRLSSYLAQLDENGILKTIDRSQSADESESEQNSVGYSSTHKAQVDGRSHSKSANRHYDASSTALYSVMDLLDKHGLIQKNISETNIGQIVLCAGQITFQDIRMMRDLWEPIMNMHFQNQPGKGKPNSQERANRDNLKALLKALPHSLLLMLTTLEDDSFWASLDEENLLINENDITLKHGASFAGQWHCLGILDAKPDSENDSPFPSSAAHNDFFVGMAEMAGHIRTFLGRPTFSYGITPIAIFREIK